MSNSESGETTFAGLGIDDRVLRALSDVGYETPSPIQLATIPHMVEGRDVVGLAQTGTGKTAAFATPILSRIEESDAYPQALILTPTRELAIQVAEAFGKYSAHQPGVRVLPIYGGQSYGVQLAGLRRGAHIVVGTPGRVIDHLTRGTLNISKLRFVVLDEADEMLKMGFQEDVERVLSMAPRDRQSALFSATMPRAIREISKKYLRDPAEVTIKSTTKTSDTIHQRWVMVSHARKLDGLTRFLEVEPFDAMLIFVRTKQATDELAEKLRSRGFAATSLNGDIPQGVRERIVGDLRKGKIDILVATDVVARGLDVERISHVVNYDIPTDNDSYVHRIGRTGRAGRSGEALLFVTPRERRLLRSIERSTGQVIEETQVPTVDDVNTQRVAKFEEAITGNLGSPNVAMFRRLIEGYEREHDVCLADIAAALAVQTTDGGNFLLKPDPIDKGERRGDREFDDRGRGSRSRDGNDRGDRGDRGDRDRGKSGGDRRRGGNPNLATYRINVGRRQNVAPGAIVGALANEGGLNRGDFGYIDIRADHSLVELPADLSSEVFDALSDTRISGVKINLRVDDGSGEPSRGGGRGRPDRGGRKDDRDDRPKRKFRS
ncbi:DEAD/DEAH box helicase [Hoyosella rhizosphaerae]|uniref:ATP-dependent RNA helicase DeaD n=1 Tax=Hoyosella rhizosphaerae TaxID=1755582 RepID=A0A916UFJ8_9ACTN|nr:DEAD/DEAH box helicase [Hoyosella rhizosphaerae]MBN4927864.1 DEAD/DEAH box helicase [Hoyosella rhizosphaerae]GGC70565.1 ATP-dependent RNA helicase DeaD [Hoyosella rhizosphaerae]